MVNVIHNIKIMALTTAATKALFTHVIYDTVDSSTESVGCRTRQAATTPQQLVARCGPAADATAACERCRVQCHGR